MGGGWWPGALGKRGPERGAAPQRPLSSTQTPAGAVKQRTPVARGKTLPLPS